MVDHASPSVSGDRPDPGRIVEGAHRLPVRVYYEDTDAGRVVYHASYLRFFERARTEMLLLAGCDHVDMLATAGCHYIVAEANLKYLKPARLGDALVIVSGIEHVRAAGVVVHQRVIRDTEVVVEGRVSVVFVGPDGRPRRQPAAWIEAFEVFTGAKRPA